ncbi:MAG: MFS transporter [Dermatophilaceae bacterium]
MSSSTPDHVADPGAPARTPVKAAISAWIGSALEYYDFFIYGSAAALIFNKLFFAGLGPTGSTLASLATFGVAYVARPVGSFIMGHIGDTRGRKPVLFITIFGMGSATFLIGCLPTYEQAGAIAPVLLVLLRILQGLAVAGEQSGATSMTIEHAPQDRRAFYSSFTLGGTQLGFILATAVFLPVAAMPDERLYTWGWRIPFLLSAVVVFVAWWIRRRVEETPVFIEEKEEEAAEVVEKKAPLAYLGKYYVPDVLKVLFACLVSVTSTIFSIYALTYGAGTLGISRTMILWVQICANILAVFAIPTWAILADHIGRRPVFWIGAIGSALMIWPFIWSISQKNIAMLWVTGLLLNLVYSAYGGAGLGMFSEQFETRVRLSGMAIGTQFGFALGGFAPTIAAALAGANLENWVPVAVFTCVCGAVAAVSSLFMRETYKTPVTELGSPRALAAERRPAEATG